MSQHDHTSKWHPAAAVAAARQCTQQQAGLSTSQPTTLCQGVARSVTECRSASVAVGRRHNQAAPDVSVLLFVLLAARLAASCLWLLDEAGLLQQLPGCVVDQSKASWAQQDAAKPARHDHHCVAHICAHSSSRCSSSRGTFGDLHALDRASQVTCGAFG